MVRAAVVVLALIAAVGASGPAAAEALVISSNATSVVRGEVIGADQTLTLREGESATVVLPSGAVRTLRGPVSASGAELSAKAEGAANKALWATMKRSAQRWSAAKHRTIQKSGKRSGGLKVGQGSRLSKAQPRRQVTTTVDEAPTPSASGEPATVAAAPAASASSEPETVISPQTPAPSGFAFDSIQVHADGSVCIAPDTTPVLARPIFLNFERLTIIDVDSNRRAPVRWRGIQNTADWPRSFDRPTDGARYLLIVPSLPRREIEVRVLKTLPKGDALLGVLHANNCTFQIEAWLSDRLNA